MYIYLQLVLNIDRFTLHPTLNYETEIEESKELVNVSPSA